MYKYAFTPKVRINGVVKRPNPLSILIKSLLIQKWRSSYSEKNNPPPKKKIVSTKRLLKSIHNSIAAH